MTYTRFLHKAMLNKAVGFRSSNQRRKISGDFPVKCRMEPVSGLIRGGFPVKQSKFIRFHVFRVNRRNLSVYIGYFYELLLVKRDFSVYLDS